jgi:rubrerythrin
MMATTENNLQEAFAGESQANRKYVAFAKKAEEEGYRNVARLFRAAAEAETIHALGHLAALDGVGSTLGNVKAAMAGETYEYTEMYPPMLELARVDKHQAGRMFSYALKAEAVHAKLYQMAMEALQQGQDLIGVEFFLCPVCGNIEIGKAPEACPICGAKGERFIRM